jgi:hypothetical protein
VSTLTPDGSSDNTGTSAIVHRPTAPASEATWRACLVSPLAASASATVASVCACRSGLVIERATLAARWFGADGKRIRRKVSGKTKATVQDRLKVLHADLDTGLRASPNYTLRRAAEDWLTAGLTAGRPRRSRRTRTSSP